MPPITVDGKDYIEGQYFVGNDGRLMVARRDYEDAQVRETRGKKKAGEWIKKPEPVYEKLPISEIYAAAAGLPRHQDARVRQMLKIRDAARDLLEMEREGASEEEVSNARNTLVREYSAFVRAFGVLNKPENSSLIRNDPGAAYVLSLETQKQGKWRGSEIFTKRQLRKVNRPPARNAQDAMVQTMDETGKLDFDRMGEVLGRKPEDVRTELSEQGYIYNDPDTNSWVTSDVYLSGDVRGKLRKARDAHQAVERDPASPVGRNVAELEKIQPEHLSADDISIHLGATWIPASYIKQWSSEVLTEGRGSPAEYEYEPDTGRWVEVSKLSDYGPARNWSARRMSASDILDKVINNSIIDIRTPDHRGKRRRDAAATLEAQQQAQRMKDSFEEWVKEDPQRKENLERIYNEKMNDIAARVYRGEHQTFPGMASDWQNKMREHQRDATFRTVQDGTALLAHEVGFGKTAVMVAAAMERRRLGLSQKPFFVVPKTTHAQLKGQFYEIYPDANIFFAEDKSFSAENKARTLSKIKDGNWDAVIVTMENFKEIPLHPDTEVKWQERRVEELQNRLTEITEVAEGNRGWSSNYQNMTPEEREERNREGRVARALQYEVKGALDKAEARLKAKKDMAEAKLGYPGADKVTYFEDLGVDQLFVDEADNYKNLGFETRMGNIKGLPNSDSQRSWDMFLKTQYIQELGQDAEAEADPAAFSRSGVVFATGTPVANTIAETWTMMRYLQLKELRRRQHAQLRRVGVELWQDSHGHRADPPGHVS